MYPKNSTPIGSANVMRAPTLEEECEKLTPQIKELRKSIDSLIQVVAPIQHNQECTGKEIVAHNNRVNETKKIVETKLVEAKMWAGKMLEYLGSPFPKELADKAE